MTSTLLSSHAIPPEWIRSGVRERIEVRSGIPQGQTTLQPKVGSGTAVPAVSADDLATWRRAIIRILNAIERPNPRIGDEGVAARIGRLSRSGYIPRGIASFMRNVTEIHNETEYEDKVLTSVESEAVAAAWLAVMEWAAENGYGR
jgi:hypothetical protein